MWSPGFKKLVSKKGGTTCDNNTKKGEGRRVWWNGKLGSVKSMGPGKGHIGGDVNCINVQNKNEKAYQATPK